MGGMSRRAAARRFGVSESSAIKWVQRFERSGSRAAGEDGRLRPSEAGAASGVSGGAASREARHHASGAVRPAAGRARRQGRHLDDEPVLPPDRRHAQKKTLVAREQDRPDISRHRTRWRTYQRPHRSFAPGLHRRDLGQDQHDPPPRLGAARRAAGRQGPARPLEDRDLPGRLAQRPHRRALPVRRPHQRRALPAPMSSSSSSRPSSPATSSCSTISARTKERPCASAIRAVGARLVFPAQILARPQSNRAGLRQAQKLRCVKPRPELSTPSPTPSPKSSPPSPTRMRQLPQKRRICVKLNAERSNQQCR